MKNIEKLQSIFFPVEKVASNALFKGHTFSNGLTSCVYAPESKKVLNVCSDNYSLISNESLFMPIYNELTSRFGDGMLNVNIKNLDDRKFYVSFIINNKPFNVQKGDIVNPTIELRNSYDGTMKFEASVGFHRVVCSNGMMAFEKQAQQIQKHRNGNVNIEGLFKLLDRTEEQLDRFKKLSERRLTPKEMEELTELIKEETKYPRELIKEVPEVIAKERAMLNSDLTSWLLYHGFNNRLNHADIKLNPEFKVRIDTDVLTTIENFN